MNGELIGVLIGGLVGVAGAVVTGIFAVRAAKVGHEWDSAKATLRRLCDSAEAYYHLEQLYADRVSQLDPAAGAAVTVKKEMRRKVVQAHNVPHPDMPPAEIRKIRARWLD